MSLTDCARQQAVKALRKTGNIVDAILSFECGCPEPARSIQDGWQEPPQFHVDFDFRRGILAVDTCDMAISKYVDAKKKDATDAKDVKTPTEAKFAAGGPKCLGQCIQYCSCVAVAKPPESAAAVASSSLVNDGLLIGGPIYRMVYGEEQLDCHAGPNVSTRAHFV